MFKYYLYLGLRNLRRNPLLTLLMVITLATGVAASVSTLTIVHMMGNNPIPHKSNKLLVPWLDVGPLEGFQPSDPVDKQSSYKDVTNFLLSQQGIRRAAVYGISLPIEPERADLHAEKGDGLAVSSDYFSMFDVPFSYGSGWTAQEEKSGAKVMVLSLAYSQKFFGDINPVGKNLRVGGNDYRIVGVLGKWNPTPRYTHLINGNGGVFQGADGIYIPFNTGIEQQINVTGSMWCTAGRKANFQGLLDSECTWLQFWFEIASEGDRNKLQDYLTAYQSEQRKSGRLQRPVEPRLFNVTEWMAFLDLVKADSKLSAWLALGFLLLCMVNTAGLLLAKFSGRAAEVGVRRSLGANRADIFKQFLIETGVIGLVGGVVGLLLTFFGLWLISLQSNAMTVLAHLDIPMLIFTFFMAISASLLAGLLPTWRACQVMPAIQLKSQ